MSRGYGQEIAKAETSPQIASTQNRLLERRSRLERELKAVNEAIELFGKHPEISDALDLLSQIGM